MKHYVIPTVNVFIIYDGKLMLNRRRNTGYMDGWLCPVGGHIEKGETPLKAMIREIQEELGVAVKPEDLEFACVAARNNKPNEVVAFEFVIRDKNYEYKINEPEKSSELAWVDIDNLPDDVVVQFADIFKRGIIGKQTYLEVGY